MALDGFQIWLANKLTKKQKKPNFNKFCIICHEIRHSESFPANDTHQSPVQW